MKALSTWRLVLLCAALPLAYLTVAASLWLDAGYWLSLAVGCAVGVALLTFALRGLPTPEEFMADHLDEEEDYVHPRYGRPEESDPSDLAGPGPERDQ